MMNWLQYMKHCHHDGLTVDWKHKQNPPFLTETKQFHNIAVVNE